MATEQKKPRKQRIDWTDGERMKVFVAYAPLYDAVVDKERKGWKGRCFNKAQDVLPEGRRISETAAIKFYLDFIKARQNGQLDNLVPEPHDHRPASERSFVKREVPPTAVAPEIAASPPTVPTAPAPEMDPMQMILRGMTLLMQKSVIESVSPMFNQLVDAVNRKIDDQYIRLLDFWDPEAAKQVREGNVKLPPLDLTASQSNVVQLTPPPSPPPPPPKKHKVLIVGGKEDGFWTYLQDVMPECILTFADGHKPRTIPTGKQYDYVLVHWMTSHPARAVIKNYYPEHEFMSKGGQATVIDMICKKLGIDRRSIRERKLA